MLVGSFWTGLPLNSGGGVWGFAAQPSGRVAGVAGPQPAVAGRQRSDIFWIARQCFDMM